MANIINLDFTTLSKANSKQQKFIINLEPTVLAAKFKLTIKEAEVIQSKFKEKK